MKKIIFAGLLMNYLYGVTVAKELSVTINTTDNCIETTQLLSINGAVNDPSAVIWPLVRPDTTADFYVQPRAIVTSDGSWTATVFLGDPNQHYITYHIFVIANPQSDLTRGDKLIDFPLAVSVAGPLTVQKARLGEC